MRSLGIDLSANPKLTAACLIKWEDGEGEVEELALGAQTKGGVKDATLLDLADRADKVAIDAPFGYPAEFVLAITEWARPGGAWPTVEKAKLRYRATDSFVAAKVRRPLSVSSERIASTAWRCAQLLSRMEQRSGKAVDRAGGGHAVEVYPAAALLVWGLAPDKYKGRENERHGARCSVISRISCRTWRR
jgi:predicted nuclease with RNAse H fold